MASKATVPLIVSQGNKRRIVVGLSWNPRLPSKMPKILSFFNPIKDFLFERSTQKSEDLSSRESSYKHYDLDLGCLIFDKDGVLLARISPDADELVNENSSVYHSGENLTGSGGAGDDEQIHIETVNLPPEYKHFFFLALSDSKFPLGESGAPTMRIADGKTEKSVLTAEIQTPESNPAASAYVFCHLQRDGDNWEVSLIGEYGDFTSDWENFCKEKIGL
jgi:stress response protein SCP2